MLLVHIAACAIDELVLTSLSCLMWRNQTIKASSIDGNVTGPTTLVGVILCLVCIWIAAHDLHLLIPKVLLC